MKKALLLLVALFTATIAFASVEIDGIYYNLNDENKTAEVTYQRQYSSDNYYDIESIISIPSIINFNEIEYNVTSIGNWAFYHCSFLSITIPNSITSIGEYAFYYCESLTSINIPNNVTYIGKQAFQACRSLKSIIIGNNVTSIGEYAFSGCSSLTSISIPNSITSIGNSAFSGCTSLTSITIPNSVTSIGDEVFSSCFSLTSISIPNNITSIGNSAFGWCTSLTSITIPNSVTSIGGYAFQFCTSLTSISIPNSVTSIGEYAFYWCKSLISITIPNSITSIENYVLYQCSSLTSITIPNSVTSIESYVFNGCDALTFITCLSSTPPSVNDLYINYSQCTLFVPKGSLNDYKNHSEWGKFLNIQELEGKKYTITTKVNDDTMGSVIGRGEYEEDSEITLTATANNGYRFVKWSDGNTENPRTITVTQDSTFTAEFALEEFALYAISASPELGYVKHTIEAIAIEGFEFDRWSDDNTDNPRTIILTEDTKLYAYFRMAQGGNPVDIETLKISSVNVYANGGVLYVEGATSDYHVLDAAGRLVYSGSQTVLTLPRGIYLVTINGEVEKIVL